MPVISILHQIFMLKIVSKVSVLGEYVAKDVFNKYKGNAGEVIMGSVLKMLSARCVPLGRPRQ